MFASGINLTSSISVSAGHLKSDYATPIVIHNLENADLLDHLGEYSEPPTEQFSE